MSLRLLFAGTPEFALPALHAALGGGEVLAVLTQPDRPAGRGRQPQASPVKRLALEHGIAVLQPPSLRDAEVQAQLRAFAPDLLIVVAYGLILPQAVLDIPRFGAWNVHASLLPRWRGAAPIQRAIEAGDAETGVCLMQMEKGLDTGPVLLRERTEITPDDSGGSLHDRLATMGGALLGEGLARLRRQGTPLPAEVQPEVGVTYAHKLDKAEARLDWQRPADELARKVRAFQPWPVAEAEVEGERLRIHAAIAVPGAGAPGAILAATRAGIDVACGADALRLLRVQREGGKPMAVADHLNARPGLRR